MPPEFLCICVEFAFPPIPVRSFDWAAWIDGTEERGPIGRGATREAAVDDLLEQLEEEELTQ
jgi:hypothetical protein